MKLKRIAFLVIALALLVAVPAAYAIVIAPARGGTPTAAANLGSSPTLAGGDSAFVVTLGTAPGNPFVVRLAGKWTTAPVCVAANQSRADLAHPVEVSEVMTFANTFATEVEVLLAVGGLTGGGGNGNPAAAVAGDKYAVLCFGP